MKLAFNSFYIHLNWVYWTPGPGDTMIDPVLGSRASERNGIYNSQSPEERCFQKLSVWWGKPIGSLFQVTVMLASVGGP